MAPNPKCIVCSDQPQAVVKIDTNRISVKQFRDEVLVKALGMVAPDAMIEAKGSVVISSEEGETDGNNDKKLCELQVVDGCILKVDDFVQRYELTVIIAHKEAERDGDAFEVIADPDSLKPDTSADEKASASSSSSSAGASSKESDNGEPKAKKPRHEPQPSTADSDDDLCIVEDVNENDRPTTSAMGKSESENNQMASNSSTGENNKAHMDSAPSTSSETRSKRPRIEEDDDDDLILIDDD